MVASAVENAVESDRRLRIAAGRRFTGKIFETFLGLRILAGRQANRCHQLLALGRSELLSGWLLHFLMATRHPACLVRLA